MRRRLWLALFAFSGCVTTSGPPPQGPPPPPAPVVAYYGNEHAIPEMFGGGWCYINGQHQHNYYPDQPGNYVMANGFYYWNAPVVFTYYSGHPLPGGGWCMIVGPHSHPYYPPYGEGWEYRRGSGYVYGGRYRQDSPPPSGYWARPAEPPQPPPGAEPAPMHPIRRDPPPEYHPIVQRVPEPNGLEGEHRPMEGGREPGEEPNRAEPGKAEAGEPRQGEGPPPAVGEHREAQAPRPAPAPAASAPARRAPPPPPPRKKKPGEK